MIKSKFAEGIKCYKYIGECPSASVQQNQISRSISGNDRPQCCLYSRSLHIHCNMTGRNSDAGAHIWCWRTSNDQRRRQTRRQRSARCWMSSIDFWKNGLRSGMKIKPQSTSASRQAEAGWHRCPFQWDGKWRVSTRGSRTSSSNWVNILKYLIPWDPSKKYSRPSIYRHSGAGRGGHNHSGRIDFMAGQRIIRVLRSTTAGSSGPCFLNERLFKSLIALFLGHRVHGHTSRGLVGIGGLGTRRKFYFNCI
jgi:hypothetical protein